MALRALQSRPLTLAFRADARGFGMGTVRELCSSVLEARGSTLAGRTLTLEDVCSVASVDRATGDRQAEHSVRDLLMIGAWSTPGTGAKLGVPVHVADLCFGC